MFIGLIFIFLFSCGNDFVVTPQERVEIFVEVEDTAAPTEIVIDYFEQPSKPDSLDVLFVLDTSCSMVDDYEKVSLGMDLLRDDIENLTHDYQMAIINSSLLGTYFVGPFDQDSDSIEILLAPMELGRDPIEQGFGAHYLFATTTEEGLLFLRPDVDKLIVYISDEDEQSPISVPIFKEWLDSYHEDVEYDIITIAIVESSYEDCLASAGTIGYRFDQLSQYFNKRAVDFCGNWQLALADSSFLLTEITHLQLSREPLEDTLVIYQDGVKEQDWYYLESTNSVYFEFEIVEGAVIKVGYNSYLK